MKNITGKLLSALGEAESGWIDLDASELDANGGFTHAAVKVTEAGSTGVDNVLAIVVRDRFRDAFKQHQADDEYSQ